MTYYYVLKSLLGATKIRSSFSKIENIDFHKLYKRRLFYSHNIDKSITMFWFVTFNFANPMYIFKAAATFFSINIQVQK